MLKSRKDRLAELPRYYFNVFRTSSLVKNISKVYGGDILSKVFAFGTLLLLIRGLSVNDYASYTAFYTIVGLVPALVGRGINLALVRFTAEYLSKKNRKPLELYFVGFLFEVALFTLFCIVLLPISDKVNLILFGKTECKSSFQYGLLAGLGLLLIQVGRSVYQAEERFGLYVKSLWFQQILTFLLIFFLFLLKKLDFSKAVQAVIAVNFIVGTTITYNIFRIFEFRQAFLFILGELGLIKEYLSSTKWLIAYFFTLAAFQNLGVFMLSHLSIEEELANYGVAFRYYSIALLLLGSIHAVLLPKFSKVEMQDIKRQRMFTLRWLKNIVWLIIPLVIAVLIGKPLFIWINGSQYEKAFYIFVVFSVGIWLSLVFSPLVHVLMSRKEFRFLFLLSAVAFILTFTGNYMLVPIWGGFGAALVTILSNILIHGFILLKVLKEV